MNAIALNIVTNNILTAMGRIWKEKIKKTFDPWEREKRKLLRDVSDPDKNSLSVLLDNVNDTRNSWGVDVRSGPNGLTTQGFRQALPGLTKSIYKNLTIKNIIGFQPMKSPVSLVYTLQYTDEGVNEEGRLLSLNVVTDPVEANSYKLQTAWTTEIMKDFQQRSMNQSQVFEILGVAIAKEINYFWLDTLFTAFSSSCFSLTSTNTEILVNKIYEACDKIVRKSKRGAGNVVVMDQDILFLIKDKLKLDIEVKDETSISLKYIGRKGTIDFYTYMTTHANVNKNKILVGYKGKNSEVDAGVIFAPYKLAVPRSPASAIVFHVPLMTRYGGYIVKNAAAYYQIIEVEKDDK